MIETILGDYSTPQNNHDRMLLEKFPNVPLSLMRDIWNIHKDFSEEQQEDFLNATITANWTEYDEKYNLKEVDLKYDNYDTIYKNMLEGEKISEVLDEGGSEIELKEEHKEDGWEEYDKLEDINDIKE